MARKTFDPVVRSQVVVAWTENIQAIAPGQKTWRTDVGERPRFVDAKNARACMWSSDGTDEDVAKARAFIAKDYPETGRVFVFQESEQEPLVRARKEILS